MKSILFILLLFSLSAMAQRPVIGQSAPPSNDSIVWFPEILENTFRWHPIRREGYVAINIEAKWFCHIQIHGANWTSDRKTLLFIKGGERLKCECGKMLVAPIHPTTHYKVTLSAICPACARKYGDCSYEIESGKSREKR